MPEFIQMKGPLPAPSTCFTCGSHEPPMIYLRENNDGQSALMCHTCVVQLGRTDGMLSSEEAEVLRAQTHAMRMEHEDMESQLSIEKARQIQVVTMSEVLKALDEQEPKRRNLVSR